MSGQRSAWRAFFAVATERQSLILGAAGILIAILTHWVAPSVQAPLAVTFYVLIAAAVIFGILLAALRKALNENSLSLPRVLTSVRDDADVPNPILLLEPSPLFGTSTLVSIFHRDKASGFEVLLGHGTVRTVQSDMKIQVKIDQWVEGNQQVVEGVINNNTDSLSQVVVRPSIVRDTQVRENREERLERVSLAYEQLLGELMRERNEQAPNDND